MVMVVQQHQLRVITFFNSECPHVLCNLSGLSNPTMDDFENDKDGYSQIWWDEFGLDVHAKTCDIDALAKGK